MKFHATNEISEHGDLVKHGDFFFFSKWCQCRNNQEFNHMIYELRLGERTAQMYVSIDIISSGHVIHKSGHIKSLVINIFRNRIFNKTYLT